MTRTSLETRPRKAIILAAGLGWRLGGGYPPKSLFELDGKSLLRRHLEILASCGVEHIVVGVGYRHHLIEAELRQFSNALKTETVFNPDYREGNVVTLWHLRERLDCGEPILLMDADVLYDERLMHRLIASSRASCLLLDRHCEAGEEPVKVCVSGERIVEFAKVVAPGVEYDFFGESVGFFKVSAHAAERLRERVETFVRRGDRDSLYEAAIRELLLEEPEVGFGFEDITGLPWTEIDFHSDLERARREIVPLLIDHHASERGAVA